VDGIPAASPISTRRSRWRRAELVALDFETTGLDLRRDEVISFGLVPVRDGRIDLAGAIYREVAPRIDPKASSVRIHHLRPMDLASAPPMSEVVETLRGALDRRFLLTWAAGVEIAFLRRIFGGTQRRWRARTIDVRTVFAAMERLDRVPEPASTSPVFSLELAASRSGIPVEQTHHALDDAFMTAELFLVAATRFEAHGPATVRTFLRTTRRGHLHA
jgi:DNA polymerase-3 subunit epsilon